MNQQKPQTPQKDPQHEQANETPIQKKRASKQWMHVKVGAFVIIGLGMAMTVIFLLGGESQFFKDKYTLYCKFDNISGLRVGTQVQLAGLNVGILENITFSDNLKDKNLILELSILKDFQNRIRQDSVANVASQGLLGDKLLMITVGSQNKEPLEDGQWIRSGDNVDLASMMRKGDELLTRVKKILGNVDQMVEEVKTGKGFAHQLIYSDKAEKIMESVDQATENLAQTTDNISSITAKIDRGDGTIGAFINDPTLYQDMKTLLGKANRNKLVRSVIRYTLKTKEEKTLKK